MIAFKQQCAGNIDAGCARLAIVAAAAEVRSQRIPDLLHSCQFRFPQGAAIVDRCHILLQFLGIGHAGNDHRYIGICCHETHGQSCILNGATGQRLHTHEADVLFRAAGDQRLCLSFNNVIGEHNGFHPITFQRQLKHLQVMERDANMADFAGFLSLQHGFHGSAGSHDLLQVSRTGIMELVEVDVIGTEIFEAGLNIPCHALFVPCHGLGSKNQLIPHPLNGLAQIFFTDRITPGRVDVVDACLPHLLHQLLGALHINPLNGNAAKAKSGDLQTGFSKNFIFHTILLFLVIFFRLMYHRSSFISSIFKCRPFV